MASRQVKGCSTSLIREMQIKATMRYQSAPIKMVIIEKTTNNTCWSGCGEKGSLLCSWWECKLMQPLRKRVRRFFKKLKIEPPYDVGISLLNIYPQKTKALFQKDTCL